jgi:predicted RNA-binding Zn-ribbon protein involved in translation (DUF1610 family)
MGKRVMICPKCKSRDIVPDISLDAYSSGTLANSYKCNNCGYTGQFFIEFDEEELRQMKKKEL